MYIRKTPIFSNAEPHKTSVIQSTAHKLQPSPTSQEAEAAARSSYLKPWHPPASDHAAFNNGHLKQWDGRSSAHEEQQQPHDHHQQHQEVQ